MGQFPKHDKEVSSFFLFHFLSDSLLNSPASTQNFQTPLNLSLLWSALKTSSSTLYLFSSAPVSLCVLISKHHKVIIKGKIQLYGMGKHQEKIFSTSQTWWVSRNSCHLHMTRPRDSKTISQHSGITESTIFTVHIDGGLLSAFNKNLYIWYMLANPLGHCSKITYHVILPWAAEHGNNPLSLLAYAVT